MRLLRPLLALVVPVGLAFGVADADAAFFTTSVKPILEQRCIDCHGPEKQKADLRLDSRAAILTGGESGAAAVPGKPDDSLLIKAIRYDGELKMPPKKKGKLADAEVATLTDWVKRGMPWPEAGAAKAEAPPAPAADPAKP